MNLSMYVCVYLYMLMDVEFHKVNKTYGFWPQLGVVYTDPAEWMCSRSPDDCWIGSLLLVALVLRLLLCRVQTSEDSQCCL